MEYQEKFIQFLKNEIPKHISLADEMADLLNVSKDSAYRRLRNETPLSLDEALIITNHFSINPGELFEKSSNLISFKYNKLYDEHNSFVNYLKDMTTAINLMNSTKGKITYAAEDIPPFHHFGYPKLAIFKIFYWSKAVLNSDFYVGQKFSFDHIHPDLLDAAKKLFEEYNKADCVEIWTEASVNSTLRQIEYIAQSGQFNTKDEAIEILNDFRQQVIDIQLKAEKSSKMPEAEEMPKNFKLYNSEVLIGNNCILLEYGDKRMVYLSHNTFNSLSTTDDAFVEETEKWIKNLIRKSTLISDVSEKHRFQFFKKIFKSFDESQALIEGLDI